MLMTLTLGHVSPSFRQHIPVSSLIKNNNVILPHFEANSDVEIKKPKKSKNYLKLIGLQIAGISAFLGLGLIDSIRTGNQTFQQNVIGTADGYFLSDAYIQKGGKIYSTWGAYKGRYTPDGKMYKGALEAYNGYVTPEGKIFRTVLGVDTSWGEVKADGTIVAFIGGTLGKVPGNFSLQEKGQIGYLAFTK